jgi:hypothetical protein
MSDIDTATWGVAHKAIRQLQDDYEPSDLVMGKSNRFLIEMWEVGRRHGMPRDQWTAAGIGEDLPRIALVGAMWSTDYR